MYNRGKNILAARKGKGVKEMTNKQVLNVMQKALKLGYIVRVTGVAQNARNRQPITASGQVTKATSSVFYVGKTRLRPYFDLTQVVIAAN